MAEPLYYWVLIPIWPFMLDEFVWPKVVRFVLGIVWLPFGLYLAVMLLLPFLLWQLWTDL